MLDYLFADYLVVGGGVAGVCCAEELASILCDGDCDDDDSRCSLSQQCGSNTSSTDICDGQLKQNEINGAVTFATIREGEPQMQCCRIALVSGSSGYIKVVTNTEKLGQLTETFDVAEASAASVASLRSVLIFQADVCEWEAAKQEVRLSVECNGASTQFPSVIRYGKLCIATGACPRRSFPASVDSASYVFTLRDVDSVARLRGRIANGARRVVLVGNGGIATELVFELEGVNEIVWAIRHATISATYFDTAAAEFFEPKLTTGRRAESEPKLETKRDRFTVYARSQLLSGNNATMVRCNSLRDENNTVSAEITAMLNDNAINMIESVSNENNDNPGEMEYTLGCSSGCSLGPHWLTKLQPHLRGDLPNKKQFQASERCVRVFSDAQVCHVYTNAEMCVKVGAENLPHAVFVDEEKKGGHHWPIWVELSKSTNESHRGNCAGDNAAQYNRSSEQNSEFVGADFVIEATGVTPNVSVWTRGCPELEIANDGGVRVDEMLRTTVANVFAAGDACTLKFSEGSEDDDQKKLHWMQLRLWTQARQMGIFCARSMAVENVLPDICFDLFTHVTTFFGYKVVLMGDFFAAKLDKPYQVHYRIRPDSSTKNNRAKNDENDDGNDVNKNNSNTQGYAADAFTAGEYIKVICKNSRVHGAVLIGETDLEETMENLILNQTDISAIEDDLLNPDVDLEDYFD